MKRGIKIVKDLPSRSIHITKDFRAPVRKVWDAFMRQEVLDKWWAASPWHARTLSMEPRPGGEWLFVMMGPNGERQCCKFSYLAIEAFKSFEAREGLCDEKGDWGPSPSARWYVVFTELTNGTRLHCKLLFDTEEELGRWVTVRLEPGLGRALAQLDGWLGGHDF